MPDDCPVCRRAKLELLEWLETPGGSRRKGCGMHLLIMAGYWISLAKFVGTAYAGAGALVAAYFLGTQSR